MLPYSTNGSCFCLDLNEIGIYQNKAKIFCFCYMQDPQRVWKNIFFTQSDNVLCFLYSTTSHVLFDHLPYLVMTRHSCLYIWGIHSISHPFTTNNTPLQGNNIPPIQSTQTDSSYCCYQRQPLSYFGENHLQPKLQLSLCFIALLRYVTPILSIIILTAPISSKIQVIVLLGFCSTNHIIAPFH